MESIQLGIENYYKVVGSRPLDELSVGKRAIRDLMASTLRGIESYQRRWLAGEQMRNSNRYGPVLCSIPSNILALIALSTVYSLAYDGERFTSCAGSIGMSVDRYLQSQQMKDTSYTEYKKVMRKYKNINVRKFNGVVKLFAKETKSEVFKLSHKQRMHIGILLLTILIEYTDSFDYYMRYIGAERKRIYFVQLKKDVREQIADEHEDISILAPVFKPMVSAPLDWVSLNEGGYYIHCNTAIKPIIGLDNDAIDKQRAGTEVFLLPYLSLIQKTEWVVDEAQLNLVRHMLVGGGEIAGLPRSKSYPPPPKPVDIDTNDHAKMMWKREMALVYRKNAKLAGQTVLLNQQIKIAEEFTKYDTLWHEWTADWRLRTYPSCTLLSPQSSDIAKGMLKFKRGVPLGIHGYKWLSINLANNIGFDDCSFDDRVKYIEDHYTQIKECVDNPRGNLWWTTWDEPWRGLATAKEVVAAMESGDTPSFFSHIPVCMDGTCNGYQHYAALSRDPTIAKYTNLMSSDKPDSIYTHVKTAAILLNESRCNSTTIKDEEGVVNPCHAWVGFIGKPMVKTPTMTTPYKVTTSGIADQIYSNVDLTELLGDKMENLKYGRDLVIGAIKETATAADDIMKFLVDVAKISAKENINLVWTCPIGVKIIQRYPNWADSSIATEFHRVYWRDPAKDTTQQISRFKQANAIAPNFIHNLDACHLYMTIMVAYETLGITDFCLAHDSYGVHAGYMEEFKPIINEQFVVLHRINWLEKFADDASKLFETEIPELPYVGTFDIEEVLKSPYFFN